MAITAADVRAWIVDYAAVIAEHRAELVALDTAIGDGDHGTNMDRGMRAAVEKLEATDSDDIGQVLKTVGMALVSKVGGAAGPLYGTLFLQMGAASAGRTELDLAGWTEALQAGVNGVQSRGRAEPGDKTMVDALLPALEALRSTPDEADALRRVGGCGRGGHAGDDPAGGAQGPRELSRPTQRRPPGPRCDVVAPAAARGGHPLHRIAVRRAGTAPVRPASFGIAESCSPRAPPIREIRSGSVTRTESGLTLPDEVS